MAELEALMRQVREAARVHGMDWIQQHLLQGVPPPPVAPEVEVQARTRRRDYPQIRSLAPKAAGGAPPGTPRPPPPGVSRALWPGGRAGTADSGWERRRRGLLLERSDRENDDDQEESAGARSRLPGPRASTPASAGMPRQDPVPSVSGLRSAVSLPGGSGEAASGPSGPARLGELTTFSTNTGGGGDTVSSQAGMQQFFRGLQELLDRSMAGVRETPVAVWRGSGEQPGVSSCGAGAGSLGQAGVQGGGAEAGPSQAGAVPPSKPVEDVRLADAARGEVYVCFEGPLGAHLKSETRDKIWKGEYVEIFSLLPLEKFNLDRVKPDECKKEEEERRRYRLIPSTFANWLQAFAILASVIGERAPENCSVLFCYLDSIGEAYRVYGGNAWLRYDEQFRQRKAVRPSIRWDHKDISLWMKLMATPRGPAGGQPFREAAGGSGSAAGRPAGAGKGCCWQFNDGTCKFGADCRFKHECSGCGGAHALARCFKRGKGRGR